MPKVTFVISEPGKRNSIVFFYPCHNGRLKYYTGQQAPNLDGIDKGTKAVLARIETRVTQLVVDYKIKGEPITKAILKSSLDSLLNKKVKSASGNMFDEMTALVDAMESGRVLTPRKRRYSPGSIKTFRFTISLLRRFNPSLTLSNTTQDTYHRFINWMQADDYSTNYIGSQIKNWKTLGKGIGGAIFNEPWFKKMQEESTDIYLNEKELLKMYNLKLIGRHEVVRDWFILDCYTGLRISDLVLLNKRNLSGDTITIANEKTGERVIIPLHPLVKIILGKYNGFPPAVKDYTMNAEIKEVGEKAELNEKILFTITKGGRRQDTYLKKWQAISNHTARRSFITNLLKNGVPHSIVMKLTGIRSPATLARYDKLGSAEAATIAAKHKFFK